MFSLGSFTPVLPRCVDFSRVKQVYTVLIGHCQHVLCRLGRRQKEMKVNGCGPHRAPSVPSPTAALPQPQPPVSGPPFPVLVIQTPLQVHSPLLWSPPTSSSCF